MKQMGVKQAVLETLRAQKLRCVLLVLAVAGSVAASLAPPQVLRQILDNYLEAGAVAGLLGAGLLYFAAFALGDGAEFAKGVLLTQLGQRIVRRLRSELAEKLERLPVTYFTAHPAGEISSVFLNDVDAVSTLFSDGLISMGADCLKILGIIGSVWLFSPALGVFALALVPLTFVLTAWFRRRMARAQQENLRDLGRLNRHIAESVENRVTVKALHKEAYLEGQYTQRLEENYATCAKVNFYDSCFSPLIQVVTAAAVAVLLTLSAGEQLGITVGTAAASVQLIISLFAPIDSLGMELQGIQKGLSGVRSANAFLNLEEERRNTQAADAEGWKKHGVDIRLEDLSFAYPGGQPVLEHVTLTVPAGSSCCFLGRTGVGKTTCFHLIAGLLEPTGGRLLIGGIPAAALPNGQKRHIFGYVEQSVSFIQGDVLRQVTLGDPEISEEQATWALQAVGLWEAVQALPEGIHTEIFGGDGFSQGQRQLLGIARAIAADPPILLLDEMSASLDLATARRVRQVLEQVGSTKTVLAITHRTEGLEHYDRLAVLENGRLRDTGTPEEVCRRNPQLRAADLDTQ